MSSIVFSKSSFSRNFLLSWSLETFSKIENAKLILRPIKNIANKYPLTKIAVDILGEDTCRIKDVKIGDLITPIDFLAYLIHQDICGLVLDERKEITIDSVEIDSFFKMEVGEICGEIFVGCKNLQYRYVELSEKAFDFLRSMYFNLDFVDNEFIEKID